MIKIISIITVIMSWSIKVIGFPHQIRKIITTKNSSSLSPILIGLSFISFVLWVIYGLLKEDYTIVFAQGIGVIVGGITLFYMWKYRK